MSDRYSKPDVRTLRGEELVDQLGPVSAGSVIKNDMGGLGSPDDDSSSSSSS